MAENILKVRIKEKYDTEAEWASSNPVLLSGEVAYSSDTNGRYKIGNGTSTWSQLSYAIPVTKSDIGLGNVENKSSATIRGELTKANVTNALGYTPPTTNTWRGIQNNLTSDSTTDSLSAAQGKVLKSLIDGKSPNDHTHNYLPLSGGTITTTSYYGLIIKRSDTNGEAISYQNSNGALGGAGFLSDGTFQISNSTNTNGNIFKATTSTATFPGTVIASTFNGNLSGTATKATQDSVGQQINTTYIKGLSVSGKTVTYTKGDGTTGTITTQDTNTTYSAGTGISLSGTTFSNSGVRSISTGGTNGTISVNTNGTSAEVAVKGLGSAAYTASSAYASSSHTHTKSQITDFPSSLPASDVYSWAKASSKPSYSWSEITDKPSSFTPASHTHNYAGSSSAGGAANSANKVVSRGNHSETASGTTANSPTTGMLETSGMYMTQTYNDSATPANYGNIINLAGIGTGQLMCEWSGSDNELGHLYYRSHRDTNTGGWSSWGKVAFVTDNVASSTKLTTSAGSATQPIYFSDGKPVACTYSLGKSVPSDAVFTDTTYSTATTSANGLMSSSDKSKLDGIAEGANNYTHPTSAGNKHIPSGGSSGQILGYSSSGTAAWTNTVSNLVVLGSLSVNRKADTDIGTRSIAIGQDASATEMGAIAIGRDSSATGLDAIAIGRDTTATGGFCIGTHSETHGSYSFAAGNYTIANQSQFSIGHYNSASSSSNSYGTIGTAFYVGNGTSSDSTSNACRITYEGAVIGKAAYQSTGADFAELREWSDGNPNAEDRRGYFVTMDGMNIRIASPGDYICGIISANPSVIGNNDEDWMGRYVFDDFGAFVYEDYEETDPETGEIRTYKKYKENPEYDPTREYAFRADRSEWDYVGLCGVIHVRDDGTCQQNGFCKCAAGGIATLSERGYRVLERVNDHIVKVLFYLTGETF